MEKIRGLGINTGDLICDNRNYGERRSRYTRDNH